MSMSHVHTVTRGDQTQLERVLPLTSSKHHKHHLADEVGWKYFLPTLLEVDSLHLFQTTILHHMSLLHRRHLINNSYLPGYMNNWPYVSLRSNSGTAHPLDQSNYRWYAGSSWVSCQGNNLLLGIGVSTHPSEDSSHAYMDFRHYYEYFLPFA